MEFRLKHFPEGLLFLLIIVLLPGALCLPTLSSCATNDRNEGWTRPDWSHQLYMSTESVVKASIGTVCPPIDGDRVPIGSIEDYLTASGPLGYLGPLGPEGPPGILGPIGTDVLHPSDWISGILNWHPWAHVYTAQGGPLSAEGLLGYRGPTAPNQYYGTTDSLILAESFSAPTTSPCKCVRSGSSTCSDPSARLVIWALSVHLGRWARTALWPMRTETT